jgi:AcrR family transcriptional regulator
MHSVSESATPLRESKRQQTARRIMRAAGRLTLEHGLEGWTMDDLAAAAETSRRTLFNYFPGKLDAVIGPQPMLPDEALAQFRAGGPTGRLVDDAVVVARRVLEADPLEPADVQLHRSLLCEHPRILAELHARFEVLTGELEDHVLAREGEAFGRPRAGLLVRVMLVGFDAALEAAAASPDDPHLQLADHFEAALHTIRDLLQ